MEKERENFYRIISLVLSLGTKAKRELLKHYLSTENITLQYLLSIYQHDLYHLYYNTVKCCKCTTTNYKLSRKRVLNLIQLEILFDRKPSKPLGASTWQCNASEFCCCQLSSKPSLTVDHLDFTLARCLLVNCCEKLFTDSLLVGETTESFLNKHQHDLYHLWQPQTTCCLCPKGCQPNNKNRIITDKQWTNIYNVTNLKTTCPSCGSLGDACNARAISGISLNNIQDKKFIRIMLMNLCFLRKKVDELTDIRNMVYGHALEVSISDQEYEAKWQQAEACILTLSRECSRETECEFLMKIDFIKTGALEESLYQQYHTSILKEIRDNTDIKQDILQHLEHTSDQMVSNQTSIDRTLDALNEKIDRVLNTSQKLPVQTSSQSIQTEPQDAKETDDDFMTKFNHKITEKEKDIITLNKKISDAETYKRVHVEKTSQIKQAINERSRLLQEAIVLKEKELIKEVETNKFDAVQKLDEFIKKSVEMGQKHEKKISNYKKILENIKEDKEMAMQFVQDSEPILDSMSLSVKLDFPCPLTFEYKSSADVRTLFGELREDNRIGPDGKEKSKYCDSLDIINKFKVETGDSSVYTINVRPDGKTWVSTMNKNLCLVNRLGKILAKEKLDFLIFFSTCDKDGNLYCSSRDRSINVVHLDTADSKNYTICEFENMYPYLTRGIGTNKENHLLVLLWKNDKSKIAIFSEQKMLIKEIQLDIDKTPIFNDTHYITQNNDGDIYLSGNSHLFCFKTQDMSYQCLQPSDETWEGKSLTIDPFNNLISTECPKCLRPLSIHVTNPMGEIIKTFTIQGPGMYGMNGLTVDYNEAEPVLWMSTTTGHVIIARFVNHDKNTM
ncbi:uncharacterized protein LOC127698262 [Mytilus californianus]|uniref:uncharacterized protein LOC127698262 n=1 Tax=Mytilus californianus TaxID=6549 RepID=UPI0022483002|nr:uncharacterized protein LOC127698262 [Mytilus californianus]